MRTQLFAAAPVAAATALLVGLVVAPPSGAAGDGYTTYAACGTKPSAKPATECRLSQTKAAFFRSAKHDATYRVCVKFPGKKKRLCAGAQYADQGRTAVVTIATSKLGAHRITWYVGGKVVGTRTLEVIEG